MSEIIKRRFEEWWHNEGSIPPNKNENHEEHTKRMCRMAWMKGNDAFSQMLKVLEEVKECSDYWSEYDVPLGLHGRIDNALKAARGEK